MMEKIDKILAELNPVKTLRVREPLPLWKAAMLSAVMVFMVFLLWLAVTAGKRVGIVADYSVKDVRDLRNKTVVLVKDSKAHAYILESLAFYGIKTEEVTLKFVAGEKEAVKAFVSDMKIDACALSSGSLLDDAVEQTREDRKDKARAARLIDFQEDRFISPLLLPGPGEVLAAFPEMHTKWELMRGIFASLVRVTLGFIIAAVIAMPLGIAMGAFTKVRALLNPVAVIGGYIPVAALVPLTLAIWGTEEDQKILFLAIAAFVGLLPLVIRAIDRVDDIYLQTAYTLGATRWQTVRRVLMPVALHDIYAALRLIYGVGWGYIILAEVVAAERGIGFVILTAQRRNRMDVIYASLLVIVVIAILIDLVFKKVGNLLFPYARG